MEKEKDIIVIDRETKKEEDENIVKLSKTYQFEGETISELDMSGLEDLTANDMIQANKVLNASGNVSAVPETNLEYALVMASRATRKPIEFFKSLSLRDAIKVKAQVTNFLFNEE